MAAVARAENPFVSSTNYEDYPTLGSFVFRFRASDGAGVWNCSSRYFSFVSVCTHTRRSGSYPVNYSVSGIWEVVFGGFLWAVVFVWFS